MRSCTLAIFLAVTLSGCAPRESAGPAAPGSSVSIELAEVLARRAAADIGGSYATVEPTGSMLPYFGSRSVLVLERIESNYSLNVGDVVVFTNSTGEQVVHRVEEVDGLFAITRGSNSRTSDGWQRPTHRVVGVFYASR